MTLLKFVLRQRENSADAVDMEDIGKMMKKGRAANAEQVKGPPKVVTYIFFFLRKFQNIVNCFRSSLFSPTNYPEGGESNIQRTCCICSSHFMGLLVHVSRTTTVL
jgi:hypothetical protein